ncbi:hypothetical protein KQX54_009161 [Cotesia glomerata]|uniref:Uncharacterized protein n=1 Tax=Cotesia glomerata TaxID=32391 RepID=A0AAV7IYE8_COTGL|nr:hypothetical protein KQX54_009161 [Cotesia glomerata]
MAELKHIHGKTTTWDQRPWGNLEDLVKKNSPESSAASIHSTLCNKPRIVDKSLKKVTKVKYPKLTRVKSVKITERVEKNCCSGIKKRNALKSKISRTNLLRSPSSAGYCESNSSLEAENKFKVKSKFKTKTKFKVNRSRKETEKDDSVQHLHRNKNKFKVKKSIEEISDCQDEDRDFFMEKSHSRKSKSRESFCRRSLTEKSVNKKQVFRDGDFKFKNCERQASDCCYLYNCSDERAFDCCQDKNRCNSKKFEHIDQKFEHNNKNLKNNNQNLINKKSSENSCDCINETDLKKLNWNKCEKYLKNISKEYRSLSSHLQAMQEEIEKSPDIELSYKLKSAKRYLNTDYPCEDNIEDDRSENEISDDEDTIKALTSLCETFKTMSREIDPVQNNEQQSCKTEHCNCHIEAEDGIKGKFGQATRLKKRRKKKIVRLHEFAFPKIVKSEKSDGRGDVRKMFVYAPEGDDQSNSAPLTLYRTCSFVNCNIKNNNDQGYKYHLTYVQKYVSPTWKPNQSGDQNYSDSSSDYG